METRERLSEVEALITPVLTEHGLTLVDLEWRREGRRWVLRFFVDKKGGEPQGGRPKAGREMEPGGETQGGEPLAGWETKGGEVSIADCQRFSGEVGDVLDASGLIQESYDLEVSSPGLNRELKKEREFRWATGKMVRCWVSASVSGRTEFTGQLRRVTDELLSLEDSDGQLRELPRSLVTKARLELDFPRLREPAGLR
jgi:ribosome maturation factor RimP